MTVKIGTNRSDRSRHCGQSGRGPTGLTGRSDRSDPSRRNPTVIRVLNRFRSVNKISCGVSLPYPINIKGHGRLRTQPNRIYQKHIFYLFSFSLYPTFPTSTCCSSLVSMVFEDALAGLPSLGQPYTCLPRRGPSRASVRRIVVVLPGDRSDRSL